MAGRFKSSLLQKKTLVWIVPLLALGATALWWSVRGPRSSSQKISDPAGVLSQEKMRDPVAYIASLKGKEDSDSINQLIQAYSRWAPYPETLEARKLALRTMLAHPNVGVALESVLTAVEADQTPRDHDPVWPELVKGVSSLWDGVTFQLGRDRVYLEERPKPHDLMLESLTNIDPNKLTEQQRMQLASDLIDLYKTLKPDQKPAADKMLTALAGTDVVDILGGRGLGENSHLKLVAERKRAIEAARGGARSSP
jgi:hypothetical protein